MASCGGYKACVGSNSIRFPYAKRSWPNAEHSATRHGQMRGTAPRLVAKCGAAAPHRRQMTRLSIDMIQSSQNHRCTLRRHFQLLIRAESASAAYTAVFWLELKQQICCFTIDRS
jgi:hypothetical protein